MGRPLVAHGCGIITYMKWHIQVTHSRGFKLKLSAPTGGHHTPGVRNAILLRDFTLPMILYLLSCEGRSGARRHRSFIVQLPEMWPECSRVVHEVNHRTQEILDETWCYKRYACFRNIYVNCSDFQFKNKHPVVRLRMRPTLAWFQAIHRGVNEIFALLGRYAEWIISYRLQGASSPLCLLEPKVIIL